MDLDFKLIYILYILSIGNSFPKSRFSNMDNPTNPNFQFKFLVGLG